MTDSWLKGLSIPDIDTLKEGQMSGGLSGRIFQLLNIANEEGYLDRAPVAIDPGDAIFTGGHDNASLSLSLPVAYDVWYLWQTVNVIPMEQYSQEHFLSLINDIFAEFLKDTPQSCGFKPLRTIDHDVLNSISGTTLFNNVPDLSFFEANGYPCIKEMRFETFLKDRSPFYDSPGPNWMNDPGKNLEGEGVGDVYSGYLSFPIGALGVMRVVSVVSASMLQRDEYQVQDSSCDPVPGKSFFPPEMGSQDDSCLGEKLIESTYLVNHRDAEYPAAEMFNVEPILPHHSLRFWLRQDQPFPVPGELIALLTKAQSLPPHVWWFQETNPFINAGGWFETEYYTSGLILAKIEEVSREEEGMGTFEVTELSSDLAQKEGFGNYQLYMGDQFEWEEIGTVYKVRVKEQDLYLRCSDFAEYDIDTVVAVRKKPGITTHNFMWHNLTPGRILPGETVLDRMQYDMEMSDKCFEINTEWVIVPITFYKKED